MLLHTDRLILREFIAADWQPTLAYQSDPLYLRYNYWEERTEENVRAFIDFLIAQQFEMPRTKFQFAVTLASTGELIGNAGIRLSEPDSSEANIGYEFASRHWGHGYATEVAKTLLALGFDTWHLHRIEAWCVAENTGSAHVLEKIGMRQEGRLREKRWMKGRWWDELHYAILAEDYQKLSPT